MFKTRSDEHGPSPRRHSYDAGAYAVDYPANSQTTLRSERFELRHGWQTYVVCMRVLIHALIRSHSCNPLIYNETKPLRSHIAF